MSGMLAVLGVVGAVVTVAARLMPFVKWLTDSPVRRTKVRREDYVFTSAIRKDLQDPGICELERMQAYTALLKHSAADPLGVPVIMGIREPTAMERYQAADNLLVFCKEEQWFKFRAPLECAFKRAAVLRRYTVGYYAAHVIGAVPLLWISGDLNMRLHYQAAALAWYGVMLAVSVACLARHLRLFRAGKFVEDMEVFRPASAPRLGDPASANDPISGNDVVMGDR